MTKKRYSVTLYPSYLEALDKLIKKGIYHTPGDAIRDGLRMVFRKYKIDPFSQ